MKNYVFGCVLMFLWIGAVAVVEGDSTLDPDTWAGTCGTAASNSDDCFSESTCTGVTPDTTCIISFEKVAFSGRWSCDDVGQEPYKCETIAGSPYACFDRWNCEWVNGACSKDVSSLCEVNKDEYETDFFAECCG